MLFEKYQKPRFIKSVVFAILLACFSNVVALEEEDIVNGGNLEALEKIENVDGIDVGETGAGETGAGETGETSSGDSGEAAAGENGEAGEWPTDVLKADQRFDKLHSLETLHSPSPSHLAPVPADRIRQLAQQKRLRFKSRVVLVYDLKENMALISKNDDEVRPIASLTKLMTAMVLLDANQDMNEVITITKEDKDRILYSRSVLKFGTQLLRYDALNLALMSSENRAANALARNYPGGRVAFIRAMNKKARDLGLHQTRFKDPAGLDSGNVSTAQELVKLMQAAEKYQLIRYFTTIPHEKVTDRKRKRFLQYVNTNRLVRGARWHIELSKTGFTNDAGNCIVMLAQINERPLAIVLLNSWGKLSKYGDANRIRSWLLSSERKLGERSYRSLR